jgi:hypothetical protein
MLVDVAEEMAIVAVGNKPEKLGLVEVVKNAEVVENSNLMMILIKLIRVKISKCLNPFVFNSSFFCK